MRTEQKGKLFRLADGTELIKTKAGGVLLGKNPLRIVRLNDTAFEILQGYTSRGYPFTRPGNGAIQKFLDELSVMGLLECEISGDGFEPFVTIIVPVYNQAKELRACLRSLKNLDYPANKIEIIVVDDGSTDNSYEVAKNGGVKAIRLSRNRGQSTARNIGVEVSRGELLAFIDSDCVADPLWLKELVPYFKDGRYSLVGGYVDNLGNKNSLLDRYEKKLSPLNMGKKRIEGFGTKSTFYVPSCNMLVLKNAFQEVGGFEEELRYGEDVDLCWKLLRHGSRLLYVPRGIVAHRDRPTIKQFILQRFYYGTSESVLYKQHPYICKYFPLRSNHALFLPFFLYTFMSFSILAFVAVVLMIEMDCALKIYYLRKKIGLSPSYDLVRGACYKSAYALVTHFLNHLLRYYFWLLLLASFFFRPIAYLLLLVTFLPAITKYVLRKPKLGFSSFCLFFLIDQLAYQSGVIWGAFRNCSFRLYRLSFKVKPMFGGRCLVS